MEKFFLSVREAAELLGITPKAAWRRIERGELPHRRWGRRVLISTTELSAFMASLPGRSAEEAVAAGGEGRGCR